MEKIQSQLQQIEDIPLIQEEIPIQESPIDLERSIENNDDEWLRDFTQQLQEHADIEEYALIATDPSYNEAITSTDAEKWNKAMKDEYNSLISNDTWTLIPKDPSYRILKGKWVLKIKDPNRRPIYKARWVAKGFQQQHGIDFNETFANTVNPVAWRLILGIATYMDYEIIQWDVKTAFINAPLKEKVYIQQPIGFEDPTKPDYICLLQKALYGLKQAGREWEHYLRKLLELQDIYPLKTDQSIYTNKDKTLILISYVDDIIVISNIRSKIDILYENLRKKIEIKDLGNIDEFLGIKIQRNRQNKAISFSQSHYIDKILNRYGFNKDYNKKGCPIPTGQKIEPLTDIAPIESVRAFQREIGAIMYLMTKTRPDLAYPIGYMARYMANPGPIHFKILIKVWQYLSSTRNLGLSLQSDPYNIECYVDSDWGGDIGTRRSTTGYIFTFRGAPLSWTSKLQKTTALSSCEAEYMALKDAVKEQQYIKAILNELRDFYISKFKIECRNIYTDSNSAIELAKNPIYHARTKHVDIQYHYVRENVQNGNTNLIWTSTDTQLADGLTKAISNDKWNRFIEGIGLRVIIN
jgi:hypothetical protein